MAYMPRLFCRRYFYALIAPAIRVPTGNVKSEVYFCAVRQCWPAFNSQNGRRRCFLYARSIYRSMQPL